MNLEKNINFVEQKEPLEMLAIVFFKQRTVRIMKYGAVRKSCLHCLEKWLSKTFQD